MQDMASEERKAADNKIVQENFHASLGAEEQQAETEAFQCGRCKQVRDSSLLPCPVYEQHHSPQRKCRYRQAQTRSADEPMTVCISFFLDSVEPPCNSFAYSTDLRDVRAPSLF